MRGKNIERKAEVGGNGRLSDGDVERQRNVEVSRDREKCISDIMKKEIVMEMSRDTEKCAHQERKCERVIQMR